MGTLPEEVDLEPCQFRYPTDSKKYHYCTHGGVHAPNGLVTPELCRVCTTKHTENLEPRKVEVPRTAKKKTMLTAAWDLAKAAGTFVYTKGVTCTPQQYATRLHICEECPERPSGEAKCSVCRCNILAKAVSPHFECPLGKWPSLVVKGNQSAQLLRITTTRNFAPGDILMITAAIRDLHKAHPGQYVTDVRTIAPEIWENNPYVTSLEGVAGVEEIKIEYPLVNQSNQAPYHFVHGFTQDLEKKLGVRIPMTEHRGEIYISEIEKTWINQVEQTWQTKDPYWIIIAGGKYDFTAKWWNPASYQAVVDHFKGRIQFVQCGENRASAKDEKGAHNGRAHYHPPLKGVLDLVGKTTLRQFIRLMYHASGVVCPVTFPMHLAAATPSKTGLKHRPCVVIAGGREPSQWEAYPNHQYLHTCGMLKCCESGGCWRSRCQQVGDNDEKDQSLCENPVQVSADLRIPLCMTMIEPEDVIRKIEMYLRGKP